MSPRSEQKNVLEENGHVNILNKKDIYLYGFKFHSQLKALCWLKEKQGFSM